MQYHWRKACFKELIISSLFYGCYSSGEHSSYLFLIEGREIVDALSHIDSRKEVEIYLLSLKELEPLLIIWDVEY